MKINNNYSHKFICNKTIDKMFVKTTARSLKLPNFPLSYSPYSSHRSNWSTDTFLHSFENSSSLLYEYRHQHFYILIGRMPEDSRLPTRVNFTQFTKYRHFLWIILFLIIFNLNFGPILLRRVWIHRSARSWTLIRCGWTIHSWCHNMMTQSYQNKISYRQRSSIPSFRSTEFQVQGWALCNVISNLEGVNLYKKNMNE